MKTNQYQDGDNKVNRRKESIEDYYGNLPTAEIDAIYKNGKFYDYNTDEEVVLQEDTVVKIKTHLRGVTDKDFERHINKVRKEILPTGSFFI